MIALPCFEKKTYTIFVVPTTNIITNITYHQKKKKKMFQVVCFRPYCIRILQASNSRREITIGDPQGPLKFPLKPIKQLQIL